MYELDMEYIESLPYRDELRKFSEKYPEIDKCKSISDLCTKYPELDNDKSRYNEGQIYLSRVGSKNEWFLGLFIRRIPERINGQFILRFVPLWSNVSHLENQPTFLESWLHAK